jgi:hypothetical protein
VLQESPATEQRRNLLLTRICPKQRAIRRSRRIRSLPEAWELSASSHEASSRSEHEDMG